MRLVRGLIHTTMLPGLRIVEPHMIITLHTAIFSYLYTCQKRWVTWQKCPYPVGSDTNVSFPCKMDVTTSFCLSLMRMLVLSVFEYKQNCLHCLRPYHAENTGSRPITEVKQRRARPVLERVTAWEQRVSQASFCIRRVADFFFLLFG